jgi:hypothetical protein
MPNRACPDLPKHGQTRLGPTIRIFRNQAQQTQFLEAGLHVLFHMYLLRLNLDANGPQLLGQNNWVMMTAAYLLATARPKSARS